VRVVYIAGYGRSGSTLLERVLSSHPGVFGLGELVNLPRMVNCTLGYCSCGEPVQGCPFWQGVLTEVPISDFGRLLRLQRRLESFPMGFLSTIMGRVLRREYQKRVRELFSAIVHAAPPGTQYLVDSSKTTWKNALRPITLARIAGLDVVVLHLVRDGRGCIWSNLKGSNRRLEAGVNARIRFATLRTAISWFLANFAALLCKWVLQKKRYLLIQYEDFVEETTETLSRIGEFLGVDFTPQSDALVRGESIPIAHQIAGNRMRSRRKIVLKMDAEWKVKLKKWQQALYFLIDWPFHFMYYGIARATPSRMEKDDE